MDFNPRSHEGSDLCPLNIPQKYNNFNPRSHEGSDGILDTHDPKHVNFNPRSHEGSDGECILQRVDDGISIHAPTRGATFLNANSVLPTTISIHAPTRGATRVLELKRRGWKFQSTLPRGERQITVHPNLLFTEFQSTLPRGERLSMTLLRALSSDFNPRSHEGSDLVPTALPL